EPLRRRVARRNRRIPTSGSHGGPRRASSYYQPPPAHPCAASPSTTRMDVALADCEGKRGSGGAALSWHCDDAPMAHARPHAEVVFHTHMPFASALTRLENPRIKEIGQTEVGMMDMIAYDDDYTGPAFDCEEGERLAKILGNKTVLFMANHGITTV